MSTINIQDACNQRKFNLLNNIPLVRNEKKSPYEDGRFTKAQLDMRRKVEVLKYKKNSSQGRQLSQKEKQAMILRGNYRGNTLFCADDHKIAVKTSSSDVPGPIITLQEDKSVPLYNYLPNRFANAIVVDENVNEWTFFVLPNVDCASGSNTTTNIASLLIRESIEKESYVYHYSTPFTFNISGNDIPIDASGAEITFELSNPSLKVFYGSNEVTTHGASVSFENAEVIVKLVPNVTSSNTFSYSAQLYGGIMNISNISLPTSPGFSYNLGISFNVSKSIDITNTPELSTANQTISLNSSGLSIFTNVNTDFNAISESEIVSPSLSTSNKTISFDGI